MHLVCPQLLEAINQGSQSRRQRRQADRLKPYIAAQVDVLPETFTLGDEKNYKGFYNKPLSQDLSYRCFVLASLEDGDTVRTFCWGGAGGGRQSVLAELRCAQCRQGEQLPHAGMMEFSLKRGE